MHPTIRQLNKDRDTKISDRMIGMNFTDPATARVLAAIEVDCDAHAPMTTNWQMLEMIGINPAMASLETVLHGLEQWGIKVINYTPSDEFLQYLRDKVLRDCVPLIPPNPDHDDFIDFSGSPYQG